MPEDLQQWYQFHHILYNGDEANWFVKWFGLDSISILRIGLPFETFKDEGRRPSEKGLEKSEERGENMVEASRIRVTNRTRSIVREVSRLTNSFWWSDFSVVSSVTPFFQTESPEGECVLERETWPAGTLKDHEKLQRFDCKWAFCQAQRLWLVWAWTHMRSEEYKNRNKEQERADKNVTATSVKCKRESPKRETWAGIILCEKVFFQT